MYGEHAQTDSPSRDAAHMVEKAGIFRRFAGSTNTHEPNATRNNLFCYTSGRWLYDEHSQLSRRYVEFNVQALQAHASRVLGTKCIGITKLPEGLYNKVLSLEMEGGGEVLARIPNPDAGHSELVVSSEVATLDFLRNVLDIPVPNVLAWSSPSSESNSVGVEYILMERVNGRQLSEVWVTLSEKQRFDLVKSLVEIERKLVSTRFIGNGSLYYKAACPNSYDAVDQTELPMLKQEAASRFVIGPTTERSFCADERQVQGEYLTAVARREISLIQKSATHRPQDVPAAVRRTQGAINNHIELLEKFITLLPYILPTGEVTRPTLMHHDLHLDNIFVDSADPTKISSIIDWQAVYTAPLFLQARFPSVFDCDDPYPWGAVQPELPDDFDTLSPTEKELAREAHDRLRLKKFSELASRKFNPLLIKAMGAMQNDDAPTSYIFYLVGQSSSDGLVPLRELLVRIYEKWDHIAKRKGLTMQCPISFTEEEMGEERRQGGEWAVAFNEYENLRAQLLGKDGWVSNEEYDEAMQIYQSHKDDLEARRRRLEQLS
ncbi:kinase-like domain-containing protein [Aspergillus minisclerotigenes]|uniref:Altered inheritance of mitochondria protein 9, mitochondrial n=1 Tax=Aspergillus minisclerotigenes TaxID=656917 RepID=A0A5N6IV82_9EURO|nr:kinase-like domain-containing protein [Aspergillus minisclerotigenes]